MNDRMYHEINGILHDISGDIIDFRVYKGATFSYLVKLAAEHSRIAVGMDTFYGLEAPCRMDYNEHNQLAYPKGYAKSSPDLVRQTVRKICPDNAPYELYEGSLSSVFEKLPERKYALALIDLFQYNPTREAIQYVYDKMVPGGVMYFLNHHKDSHCLGSLAIADFLMEKGEDVFIYEDIYFNDNRVNICRVACKQSMVPKPVQSKPKKPAPKKSTERSTPREKHNIALVLRTGGDTYTHKYVNTLAENIRDNLGMKVNLAVLTNDSTGFNSNLIDEVIPFKHQYRGWWSKIELFRPDIFTGRVFYMDLDTVVVNNIDELVKYKTTFAGIRDLYHHNFLQTGVMSWDAAHNHQVYEDFVPRAASVMSTHIEGDAKWIRENVYNYDYLPDQFPGSIVSYKAHCLNKNTGKVTIPKDASIICFHGKPRPHTITNPVITQHWKYK